MPIILNEEAKAKPKPKYASPLIQRIATNPHLTNAWKAEVLFQLGVAYAELDKQAKEKFMFSNDIDSAFTWSMTQQGDEYWASKHDQLEETL
jgi:hypothetical protein